MSSFRTRKLIALLIGFFVLTPLLAWADGDPSDSNRLAGYYKKLNDGVYLLVLKSGAKILDSLKAFQSATRVQSASVVGVGVTKNTVLGFYKFNEDGTPGKTHTEDVVKSAREVTSLTCNMTTIVSQNGKPDVPAPPHCHIAIAGAEEPVTPAGLGFPVVGGHLIEAEVGVTMELTISTYPMKVIKRPSSEFGGILIDITESEKGTALYTKKAQ